MVSKPNIILFPLVAAIVVAPSLSTTSSPQFQSAVAFLNANQYNQHSANIGDTTKSSQSSSCLKGAPDEALNDIVIPSLFTDVNMDINEDDERLWVPQTPCLSFRPLCFSVSQGYYVNLLRFKGGGILGRHRHSSPVHALTLKGSWGYKEHSWHATVGSYVFEPPGETHTLIVDEDCDEMIALFHVTGALLYTEEGEDGKEENIIGYDDVFTKLEKAKRWYAECGLGEDYVEQFIR